MYVIVVGGGEVGTWVASFLSREGHDVAVIERDPARVLELEAELDVLVVPGNGTHPEALERAGIAEAGLVVALTGSDEVNMLAALAVRTRHETQTVIRISAPELRGPDAAPLLDAIGATSVLDPDSETAQDVVELVDHPGAAEVDELVEGHLTILAVVLRDPLVLDDDLVAGDRHRVVAVSRGERTWFPSVGDALEPGDLLRLLIRPDGYRGVAERLGCCGSMPRRALLVGGDRATAQVAEALIERRIEVVIVQPPERARSMAERVERALVLAGDVDDPDVLREQDLGSFDLMAALTEHDDANVLACLLARAAHVPITVAVVHRLGLVPLLTESGVFVAAAARTDAANRVLQHIRTGIAEIVTFLAGDAEVLEFAVAPGSPADGSTVGALGMPAGARLVALVRDGVAHFTHDDSGLVAGDRVVLVTVGGPGTGTVRRFFE